MAEIQLFEDKAGQAFVEDCADLFAILKAMEQLERAYIKDWVKPEDYEANCEKLISHLKALYTGKLKSEVGSLEHFAQDMNMIVPKALQRFSIGMAATREHSMPKSSSAHGNSSSAVMSATTALITAIDSLKIDMKATDEGYPKIKEWVTLLQQRSAHSELSSEEGRQLLFDLESCFKRLEDHVKNPDRAAAWATAAQDAAEIARLAASIVAL